MISRNQLSNEERAEWDAVFDAACFDEFGKNIPTPQAAERLAKEVDQAIAMGKTWAEYLNDDARIVGFQKLIKPWQNLKHFHTTVTGEQKLVKRSNVARLRKRASGRVKAVIEAKLWEDATADDLLQIAKAATSRMESEAITRRDALHCVSLIVEQDASTLGGALEAAGYASLDSFLAEKAA